MKDPFDTFAKFMVYGIVYGGFFLLMGTSCAMMFS